MLTVAAAPLETDQVPPATIWVNCDVALAHKFDAPLIEIFAVVFPIKFDVVPVLVKLVKVPFEALFTVFTTAVTDALLPPAIPWLKS